MKHTGRARGAPAGGRPLSTRSLVFSLHLALAGVAMAAAAPRPCSGARARALHWLAPLAAIGLLPALATAESLASLGLARAKSASYSGARSVSGMHGSNVRPNRT